MATPDDNNQMPLLVVDADGNPATALVDSATGYLLISVTNDSTTPTAKPIAVDENNQYVGLVVDDSGNVVPIATNGSNKIYINFTAL